MKLSLSWIFDHIVGNWQNFDINDLVNKFNTITAEIEHTKLIKLDLSHFYIIRLVEIKNESMIGYCAELDKEFKITARQEGKIGDFLLIKIYKNNVSWASLIDIGSEKEGLLPPFFMPENLVDGNWKKECESEDCIFQIENKSITHRPDLWSHRGIAREIAAILGLPLLPDEEILQPHAVEQHEFFVSATNNISFTVQNNNPEICKRLAVLNFNHFDYQLSNIKIAHRLARIDMRPLNLIVDLTNYIMADIGQPMHAFDAEKISTKKISVERAKPNEKMILIDGSKVELAETDIIISDGKKPLSLAGIMGGVETAISENTKSILLEVGTFDPATIRRTALRLKKRTEASTRFEKTLDSNLTVFALQRFLKLSKEFTKQPSSPIVVLGIPDHPIIVTVSHDFIEKRLGISINAEQIPNILQKLGFHVIVREFERALEYQITIPTFRSSKDVTRAEDIVEEIGRFFGYQNIPLQVPVIKMEPQDTEWLHLIRKMKTCLLTSFRGHEVYNYSLFDEEFLRRLQWQPTDAITVQNPVSENWTRLVTSLIPHLFKNIEQNIDQRQELRFFEYNKVWNLTSKNTVLERTMLAGIVYNREHINFYTAKDLLAQLFNSINLQVKWKKAEYIPFGWLQEYQSAFIMHEEVLLGYAGKLNPTFLRHLMPGDAFIFEFDTDIMLQYADGEKKFKPLSKFPAAWQDISMLVPLTVTVDEIIKTAQKVDKRIFEVVLVDFFEKKEWPDQKSITIRWFARDVEKTMNKEEIDDIHNHVLIALKNNLHAVIR